MIKSKKLFLVALLACIIGSLNAQTDSPYSRYGYGILRDQAVGPSKAMGGIGYGLRSTQSANPMNPASYSSVDSLTFLFDIGVNVSFGKLDDGTTSENKTNGGLDYITILVPLKKGLGLSFGVIPFSSIGYKLGTTETNGSVSYTKTFSGSGGISQVYAGLGYNTPLKGLSVGANASFLFGTLDHYRALPALSGTSTNTSLEYSELSVKAAKFDIGIQYQIPVAKDRLLTLGAVYSPKISMKADYENRHYELASNETKGDTISVKGVDAGIPNTIGAGFTFGRQNRWQFGADVTYQNWSDVKYSKIMGDGLDNSNRFNDRWKYAVGGEFLLDPYGRSYFKRMKFRGGLNYSNSYLNAMNKDDVIDGYKEYGATLGFGFPIWDNLGRRVSYLNLNFEYKKLKPNVSNMIDEQYFGISVNVNINELWFFRRKVD
ncbi:long-subunit fatty acid transport protein [Dysgonomonas hofstadii]|uniref:Long-subunit fatty acid transport protein n=1 Tax=Dysgonomonas hofstadii TaxID=637886 RepID=A0A840CVZ4_9BACT|nr:outer membrane protein transport protein [Dysgonomonas hofstadii]MBB4035983.1 long-subunit fatty acid transport protein [Dysgonomonas hofstadii]